MKQLILFTMITLISIGRIESQVITDTTIAMIAFWEVGDEVIYEFKETEDKLSEGKKTLKETTYDVRMTIVDSTANHYIVKWEYENAKANYELEEFEKDLLEVCADIPVQYKTDELGGFQTIENWKEMKEVANGAFEKLITKKGAALPDSIRFGIQNMLMGMFESEAQVNFWARDLRFFHYLYGKNLQRNAPIQGMKYYTNPFIKTIMEGSETIKVLAVDEENWIAKVKVESGIAGEEAKALMIDFAKNNMEKLGLKDESEIDENDIPEYGVKEEMNYIYDMDMGYILKGSYTKLTTLNQDYKRTTYEYRLKK